LFKAPYLLQDVGTRTAPSSLSLHLGLKLLDLTLSLIALDRTVNRVPQEFPSLFFMKNTCCVTLEGFNAEEREEKREKSQGGSRNGFGSRTGREGSPGDFRGISGKVMLGEPKGGQVDA
jgi:hypothetical protein